METMTLFQVNYIDCSPSFPRQEASIITLLDGQHIITLIATIKCIWSQTKNIEV